MKGRTFCEDSVLGSYVEDHKTMPFRAIIEGK